MAEKERCVTGGDGIWIRRIEVVDTGGRAAYILLHTL